MVGQNILPFPFDGDLVISASDMPFSAMIRSVMPWRRSKCLLVLVLATTDIIVDFIPLHECARHHQSMDYVENKQTICFQNPRRLTFLRPQYQEMPTVVK